MSATPDTSPDLAGRNDQVAAVGSSVIVTLGGALGVFLTGAVSVQIGEDLDFGPARLGVGTLVFFTFSALGSPIAGRIAQQQGNRQGMRLAAIAALTAAVLIGTAVSPIQIFVGLAFAGAASALAAPACNALLAGAVSEHYRALSFGIKQSAVPMATLLGGLAVPAIALTVGWRAAYFIPGLVAIIALITIPDVAQPKPSFAAAERPSIRGTTITVLAIGTSFGAAAGSAVGAFMVPALVDGGIAESAAGRAVAIGGGATVAARILIGALQDRIDIPPLRMVAAILLVGTAALGILATGPSRGLELLVPLAFIGSWGWPGLYAYAVVQAFPAAPAAAAGYTQAGAFTGAAIGPFVFGLIADNASFQAGFGYLAVLTTASAIGVAISASLVIRRNRGEIS